MIAASGPFESATEASNAAWKVLQVLDPAVTESPRGEPIDLWASALQLTVAILGANVKAVAGA